MQIDLDVLERDCKTWESNIGSSPFLSASVVLALIAKVRELEGWSRSLANVAAEAEAAALKARERIDELEQDAARYRAIRACGSEWSGLRVFNSRGELDPQSLDAEADCLVAAMAAGKVEKKC